MSAHFKIHQDTIDQVSQKADIVDIVSERVVLRKSGANLHGGLTFSSVIATGWFRCGKFLIIDLSTLQPFMEGCPKQRAFLTSYHQFWNNIRNSILVLLVHAG